MYRSTVATSVICTLELLALRNVLYTTSISTTINQSKQIL